MFFIKEGIKEFFEPFAFAFWVLFLGTIVAVHWIYENLTENGVKFIQL